MLTRKSTGSLPLPLISKRARLAFAVALAALASGTGLTAATVEWTGGNVGADWNVASNWSTGALPTSADSAAFTGSESATLSGSAGSIDHLHMYLPATVTFAAGSSITTKLINIFWGAKVIVNGGTISSDAMELDVDNSTLILNSGSVTTDTMLISTHAGTTASVSINGGTLAVSGAMTLADAGDASLTMTGGSVSGAYVGIGNSSTANGTVTLSAGSMVGTSSFKVGRSGDGLLNFTGGALSVGSGLGVLTAAEYSGSTGTINIGTGSAFTGTITAAEIKGGAGTAKLNFNHTGSVTITQKITGSMIVNKLAAGITTLTGASTYTGGTTISAGTLLVNNLTGSGTGTGAVTLASLAKLGGSGTISGSVISNGIIAPGGTSTAIGTLRVGGAVTWNGVAGNAWEFRLGSGSTSDKLTITGALTKGTGTQFVFDFLGGGTTGTYVLLNFGSSTFSASDFTATNLASGFTANFVKAPTSLSVVVSAVPEPSTLAAIAGAVVLGFVVIRRRKTVAATV